MNILASDIKQALKKIGSAKSESLFVDTLAGRLVSNDSEIAVVVAGDKLKDPDFGEVFCVNARKFTTVVNRMSGTISLTGGKSLKLESAKAKVEIELLPNKLPPFSPPKETLKLPLQTVKALLNYVAVGADTNKAAAQGGVAQLTSVVGGGFSAAAIGTNGSRLVFESMVTDNYLRDKSLAYLIPLPALEAIKKLDGETLHAQETDKQFYFADATTSIYARKLVKQFPNYADFVPKTFKFSVTLDARKFEEALRTVEPFVPDAGAHAVSLLFSEGNLKLTASDGGKAEDEVPYTQVFPDPIFETTEFKNKLNFVHLMDFVKVVSGDILFQVNTDRDPAVLEAGGRKLMTAAILT
jgi:DNA polymerase III sliding clamp (beta) subunit (PCNA family)